MEYCFTTDFDLLEIAKLISPWLLALVVYFIWHSQKKKEVLAKFANELILKDINLHTEINKKTEIDIKNQYYLVRDYYNNIKLFSYLIDNKKHKEVLDSLHEEYSKLGRKIIIKDANSLEIRNFYREIRSKNEGKYVDILISYINFKIFF